MHVRSRLVAAAVLVSLLTGCATVREVDLKSGGSQFADINAAARRKSISVELVSGETHSGLKLDVGPDTTCWAEGNKPWTRQGDEERVCVPTSDVRTITVHRRLKGCLVGGGIGLGAVVAAVTIVAIALDSGSADTDVGWGLLSLAAIGGGLSTVVGAVTGVIRGKDVYILNP